MPDHRDGSAHLKLMGVILAATTACRALYGRKVESFAACARSVIVAPAGLSLGGNDIHPGFFQAELAAHR